MARKDKKSSDSSAKDKGKGKETDEKEEESVAGKPHCKTCNCFRTPKARGPSTLAMSPLELVQSTEDGPRYMDTSSMDNLSDAHMSELSQHESVFFESLNKDQKKDRKPKFVLADQKKDRKPVDKTFLKIPTEHRGITSETPSKSKDGETSGQPNSKVLKKAGEFQADKPEGMWEQFKNAKEAALQLMQQQVTKLNDSFTQGRQDIGESEYKKQLGELEESIATYESEIAILLSCKNQFVGHFRDAEEYQGGLQDIQTDNWAYIDQLINRIGATHGATVTLHQKRSQDEQAKFRKDVIARYDPNHEDGWLWCVVSGDSYSSDSVTAAHIANYNLGEPNACAIFGKCEEPTGHLKSPCNGLLMHKYLENAFDAGRFAIVQALFTNEETGLKERGLKVVVLDPTLDKEFHKNSGSKKGAEPIELNNRRLSFPTSRRPRNRYVYFKYAMTILRRQRLQVPGANLDRRFMDKAARSLWASPGSYLGRSLLFKIALQLGFLTEDEAKKFYKSRKALPKLSPLEDRKLQAKAYQVSSAMKTRKADSSSRCHECGQHWDGKFVEYDDYTEDLSSQFDDMDL